MIIGATSACGGTLVAMCRILYPKKQNHKKHANFDGGRKRLKNRVFLNNVSYKFMNQHFTYRVRPGYGSKKLLIEFLGDTDSDVFKDALENVLKEINAKTNKVEDLWMNDEILYHFKSDYGRFELSS